MYEISAEQLVEGRYKLVRAGLFWRIRVGDGTALYGRFFFKSDAKATIKLLTAAFLDGAFYESTLMPSAVQQMAVQRQERERIARWFEQRAAAYAEEHGTDDCGALSFGRGKHAEVKQDYFNELLENAEAVRAMTD